MTTKTTRTPPKRRRPREVVGPRLRKLLFVVFALFALLSVNAVYLGATTLLEWSSGETYQDYFYQYMFLAHLALGLLLIVPLIVYGLIHISKAYWRPNRRAVRVGYALFTVSIVLLVSGLVLTRGVPLIEIRDPEARRIAYWTHVVAPFVAAWLFVLHRLAGKKIRWRVGGYVTAAAVLLAAVALFFQSQDPRQWNVAGPDSGEQYFFPSLARTASGDFIPARAIMNDEYCAECHADVHASWANSVHHIASFNNPAYLFAVRGTREHAMERDGNVQAARFCAGCHDPVPFFSGAFDDPQFDDVNHPTSQAGITCTSCHAITHVNSPRGNADYTIEEPLHYPFAFSDNEALQWINRALVKAKPEFHKKTFLKPLHRSTEFCSACHKVHLPEELNGYKWLRGQNHYDSFLLSGVSGHGVSSFYYPPRAEANCNGCHMKRVVSDDFGARRYQEGGGLMVHDHQFPSANTAIVHLLDLPGEAMQAHRDMLEGSLRVDIFGLKREGRIDGELTAPLRPEVPRLVAGESYLVEAVLRTLTLGHLFTQGTADSNQVWVEVTLRVDGRISGKSGGMDPASGEVDPWSHFVNAYVIDREGRRIDRRNAEDIFTTLYNNQIPPGAADVVHYRFEVPEDARESVEIEVALHYRKFDTIYYRHFTGDPERYNDLPVTTIARDKIRFAVGGGADYPQAPPDVTDWMRWNDYGIGLLRKRGTGELRQAEEAFRRVADLKPAHGYLNLARVYLREGRLDEAVAALREAATQSEPAPPWTVAWFTGLVNKQNGYLEEAADNFRAILDTGYADARRRGFDFSKDYRVINELGGTLFELAKLERGDARRARRDALLAEAAGWYEKTLAIDPENVVAHYGLAQIHAQTGDSETERLHRDLHATYKVDDNAGDVAIANARRANPAADNAASAVVIYDLQREQPRPLSVRSGDVAEAEFD